MAADASGGAWQQRQIKRAVGMETIFHKHTFASMISNHTPRSTNKHEIEIKHYSYAEVCMVRIIPPDPIRLLRSNTFDSLTLDLPVEIWRCGAAAVSISADLCLIHLDEITVLLGWNLSPVVFYPSLRLRNTTRLSFQPNNMATVLDVIDLIRMIQCFESIKSIQVGLGFFLPS